MTKLIPISSGKAYALVDDGDFEYLSQFKWRLSAGYARHSISNGRINGKRKFKEFYMHKIVNKTPDGMETDHIDRNRLNNQKSNLRACTHAQNQRNHAKRKGAISKYKGVSWCVQTKKWKSCIAIPGRKSTTLGRFDSEKMAALDYNKHAIKHFGEFAYLNGGLSI